MNRVIVGLDIGETKFIVAAAEPDNLHVAALGEYYLGEYTESRLLYLTLGTGLGGGFVIDGKLYRGGMGGRRMEPRHGATQPRRARRRQNCE